ncbi:MAG: hypothetical protein ACD_58C00241G0004 [uncultured bacterium]|nr:MAG: hypothetical protein ACD_58C00241G0004 [uncultured bacterium]
MTNIKTSDEIIIMEEAGKILAEVFKKTIKVIIPGMTKLELDTIIEKFIIESGATPSFKNYKGYKYSSCLSVNSEIVHGMPNNDVINDGDILGIDIGVNYNGYHADSAITVPIGKVDTVAQELINVTKKSLDLAISKIKPGVTIGQIQKTIQNFVESKNYCLVRSYSGHGIGKNLQEDPIIPNYYGLNNHLIIKENAVFCIEPMVIVGKNHHVAVKNDGWTVISASDQLAAHFEHTVAVTKKNCKVLTK